MELEEGRTHEPLYMHIALHSRAIDIVHSSLSRNMYSVVCVAYITSFQLIPISFLVLN